MAANMSLGPARRTAAIGIVVALIAFAPPAIADDLQKCHDDSGDSAIAACTRAIGAGKLTIRNRAVAYTSRGVEWRAKGRLDRAIADHSQAIKLDPNLSEAFYNRGNAFGDKGENDRAITDYDQAIRLNPKFGGALNNRGLARRLKGDTAGGDADIARAKQLDKR